MFYHNFITPPYFMYRNMTRRKVEVVEIISARDGNRTRTVRSTEGF
jgi:hypothetical protein